MRGRTFATRICRYDLHCCEGRGDTHGQEHFAETERQAVEVALHPRRADRFHPAPGLAAACRHFRARHRYQSDADAMGGARQAERDRAVLAKPAWAADGDGCRHHQGRDRPPYVPRPDRDQLRSRGRPPPSGEPHPRRAATGRESRAQCAGDLQANAGAARYKGARGVDRAPQQAALITRMFRPATFFFAEARRVGRAKRSMPTLDFPQRPTISGTFVAGGVLRLRWVRTMPSMMVMPTPGRSPSRTLSSSVLPAECCALSMMTKSAARPISTRPQSSCRIRAVLPVAKQNAISAGSSPSEDSIETMRRMPSGCTPEPAGASVPRMTRCRSPISRAVRSVNSAERSLPLCTSSSPRLQPSQMQRIWSSGSAVWPPLM